MVDEKKWGLSELKDFDKIYNFHEDPESQRPNIIQYRMKRRGETQQTKIEVLPSYRNKNLLAICMRTIYGAKWVNQHTNYIYIHSHVVGTQIARTFYIMIQCEYKV